MHFMQFSLKTSGLRFIETNKVIRY